MANPFDTDSMAAGYATSRPAVHPLVIERVIAATGTVERVLDVGCGAGMSTRPLDRLARQCVGLEPVQSMVVQARQLAPHALFAAGRGEVLPFRAASFDAITAAGSMNYMDLDRFFPEAARVLTPGGVLVVYDFSPGKTFRGSDTLDGWFAEFQRRYPPPTGATALSPEILAGLHCGFRVRAQDCFEIGLPLTAEFYRNYMLTETSVALAVSNGARLEDIAAWCAETLTPVFAGETREVLFRGYIAYMVKNAG